MIVFVIKGINLIFHKAYLGVGIAGLDEAKRGPTVKHLYLTVI